MVDWTKVETPLERQKAAFDACQRRLAAPDRWVIEREPDGTPCRMIFTGGSKLTKVETN